MPLTRLSLRTSPEQRDALSAALFAAGAQGLAEEGEALVTVLGEHEGALCEALVAAARGVDASVGVETSVLPDVDWTSEWKTRIRAHELGALQIVPPWLAEGCDAARTIVIEPEMAFGTGEHETTRCVVRLMPDVVRAGDVVADLGAGSAVLAIAAAKLGAARVAAIELDPDAIPNAEFNVDANGVRDRVTVLEGDATVLLPLVAPVRVVLANILSSVITMMLPVIGASLAADGAAIFSGILVTEREQMLAAFEAHGWRVVREISEGEWWAAVAARAAAPDAAAARSSDSR